MQITLRSLPGVAHVQPVAPGAGWIAGKLLPAKIISVQDLSARLLIEGQEYVVTWPGDIPPAPGSSLVLRVLGFTQGLWRLELISEGSSAPLISLLEVLERAGLPITYGNLLAVRRATRGGSVSRQAGHEGEEEVLCPWDKDLLQQLIGWEGILAPAMLTVQPFPLGLFGVSGGRNDECTSEERQAWLLALELEALGQVEVIGQGEWPKQSLTVLAQEETVTFLKKREQEVIKLLTATGMVLEQLAYCNVDSGIVRLLKQDMLTVAGCDISL